MTNITLSVPDELHRKMKKHSDIRWSEVARRAIAQRIEDLEELDRLTAKSTLTKKDVMEISKKINKAAAKKF